MIKVPVSTVERPLTAIDFIAALTEQCKSTADVQKFCDEVPMFVLHDERFGRAVAARLRAIHETRAPA